MDSSSIINHINATILLSVNPQSTIFLIVLLSVLLLLSFIISGAEVAFFSLQAKDINMLKTKQHDSARRIITLLEERKAVYISLLIAGTIINISIIILANFLLTPVLQLDTFQFLTPLDPGLLIKIVVITFIIVLVGKILPKVWATHNNLRFAYTASAVVEAVHLLLRRISLKMVDIADNIGKHSGASQMQTKSMRELDEAIDVNTNESSTEEKNILKGVVKFGNISVRQVMRFRLDVNGIEYNTSFSDLIKLVEDLHYSRLPVYRKNLDDIAGILNTKDLLPYIHEKDFDWRVLIRPSMFVPESKLIKDLLHEFQSRRIHFAIVVDEFGGTSGIVTMEDILEEIVGDIRDEFDEEEITISKLDNYSYIVDGKVMLHDMCRAMNLSPETFDEIRGESDSLGGLVLEIAGEFPKVNDVITTGDFEFTILEVAKNRVTSIKVTINQHHE